MPVGEATHKEVWDMIRKYHAELTDIRRDIHAHGTAELIAQMLQGWGIEVHRAVGGTGIVRVLRSGNDHQAVGLRADMDALPIDEANAVPYRSRNAGRMHACGHDGHATMLLATARYLAETREFNRVVNFIFQLGEEGMGGAISCGCSTAYGSQIARTHDHTVRAPTRHALPWT